MKKLIYEIMALLWLIAMSGSWGCLPTTTVYECKNDGNCPKGQACATSPSGKNKLCYAMCSEKGAAGVVCPPEDKPEDKVDCVCTPRAIDRAGNKQLVYYPCTAHKEETCNGKDDDCDGLVDNGDVVTMCPLNFLCKEGNCVKAGGPVFIKAGAFRMGAPNTDLEASSDEKPQREVMLTRDYWIDATEVVQRDFQALMGYNPSFIKDCGGDCPVITVSWYEALAYSNARSKRDGLEECFDCTGSMANTECQLKKQYSTIYGCKGWRLPTEAEWEYAARAGTTEPRYGNLDEIAWYGNWDNSFLYPVGQKKANAWGLYDTLGNVWEWCWDWYGGYASGAMIDPAGPASGSKRTLRGGGGGLKSSYIRISSRSSDSPNSRSRFSDTGFRLVRVAS